MNPCPECKTGKLYERITEDDYTERSCYSCGYIWDSSKAYDDLTVRLHKEYFPTEFKWVPTPSAEIRQRLASVEEWTKP